MNIGQIISIIAWLVLVILILTDYIIIKKPYKYIAVLLIIPAIIVKTPLISRISHSLELIIGAVYLLAIIMIILSCVVHSKKVKN